MRLLSFAVHGSLDVMAAPPVASFITVFARLLPHLVPPRIPPSQTSLFPALGPLHLMRHLPAPLNINSLPDAFVLPLLYIFFFRSASHSSSWSLRLRLASSASGRLTTVADASMPHPRLASNGAGERTHSSSTGNDDPAGSPPDLFLFFPFFFELSFSNPSLTNFVKGARRAPTILSLSCDPA